MKKRKKAAKRHTGCFFFLAIACLGLFAFLYLYATPAPQAGTSWQQLNQLTLTSKSAAVLDLESGQIVYARGTRRRAPASLTKLMTALVTVETTSDLEQRASLSSQCYSNLIAANAAMAGFAPGEAVTIRDLLHGLLLSSGADAADALAEFVSGSEADFVEQMNNRAKALQLDDTHFTNAWGMDQWGMYSTASDIALLLDAALKNDLLRGILTTPTYCTESGLELSSTLLACGQDLSLAQGRILGGKTGYTEAAGLCLASFAEIGGREYIVVTMGADGNHTTSPYHIQDTIVLYNAIGRQLAH